MYRGAHATAHHVACGCWVTAVWLANPWRLRQAHWRQAHSHVLLWHTPHLRHQPVNERGVQHQKGRKEQVRAPSARGRYERQLRVTGDRMIGHRQPANSLTATAWRQLRPWSQQQAIACGTSSSKGNACSRLRSPFAGAVDAGCTAAHFMAHSMGKKHWAAAGKRRLDGNGSVC